MLVLGMVWRLAISYSNCITFPCGIALSIAFMGQLLHL